jgi:hypothetical protein
MTEPINKPTEKKKGWTPEERKKAVEILKPGFLKRLRELGILKPKKTVKE